MFFYARKIYSYSFCDAVCCFVFAGIAVSGKMEIMTSFV